MSRWTNVVIIMQHTDRTKGEQVLFPIFQSMNLNDAILMDIEIILFVSESQYISRDGKKFVIIQQCLIADCTITLIMVFSLICLFYYKIC